MNESKVMPWETNEEKELLGSITSLAIATDFMNRRWAQKNFESFQYVMGNHNLKYSKNYDFAVDSDFVDANTGDSQNKAQTNYSRQILESLSSFICSQPPELDFFSLNQGSSADRVVKVMKGLKNAYDQILGTQSLWTSASISMTLYSQVWSKVSWNPLKGRKIKRVKQQIGKIPKMTTKPSVDPMTGATMQTPIPVVDATGQVVMTDSWQDVTDESGKAVIEEVTGGDVDVEILTPFEIRMDPIAKDFNKIKWIQQLRVMDYDEFMREFENVPGVIQKNIEKVRGGAITSALMSLAVRHFIRVMISTPPTISSVGRSFNSSFNCIKNKVFVIEHYDRPSEGHKLNPTPWLKEGRRSIIANGTLIAVSTPQYRTNKDSGWHPFSYAVWLPLFPSMSGSGPLNDVIAKNRQVNLIDNKMQMAMERNGSLMLVNARSGIDKEKLKGEPFQTAYVSEGVELGNAVHFVSNEHAFPNQMIAYREIMKSDAYEISGSLEALRGEKQAGVTSGYQAKIMEEREKRRLSLAMRNFERFLADSYEKLFSCIQQNAVKVDESVISRIKKTTEGEVSENDVTAFLNGFDFGVDISVKAFSTISKSEASQQALVQEVMANPAIQQIVMSDPIMMNNYLEFMGANILRNHASVHIDRAREEHSFFMDNWSNPNVMSFVNNSPIVVYDDDDMLHIQEHKMFFLKNFERFKKNPPLMTIYMMHQAYHEQNAQAKQGLQMADVAMDGPNMEQRAEENAAMEPRGPEVIQQKAMNFIEQQKQKLNAEVRGQSEGKKSAVDEPTPE